MSRNFILVTAALLACGAATGASDTFPLDGKRFELTSFRLGTADGDSTVWPAQRVETPGPTPWIAFIDDSVTGGGYAIALSPFTTPDSTTSPWCVLALLPPCDGNAVLAGKAIMLSPDSAQFFWAPNHGNPAGWYSAPVRIARRTPLKLLTNIRDRVGNFLRAEWTEAAPPPTQRRTP